MTSLTTQGGHLSAARTFCAALVFVAAAPVFWNQVEIRHASVAEAYENAVLYQRVYPALRYGFERLSGGEIPLWNPNQACGVPFLADPSAGLFQPLNAVFLWLPVERGMAVHAYISLALMGIFFVLFARSLGVHYVSAVFGGMVYAFCGASAAAMSRPALAGTLAWLPFFFWCIQLYAAEWRFGAAVLGGIAGALVILAGCPALAAAALCLAVPYMLWLVVAGRTHKEAGWFHRASGFAVMGITAAAISAVQWLPSAAWLANLEHPAETLWRFDLAGLLGPGWRGMLAQLLNPQPDALPHAGYLGIAPLMLLPAAFFHRRGRRTALFFLLSGACLLALSAAQKSASLLWFPPAALACPAVLALAVVAAIGMDRITLARDDSGRPRLAYALLAILLAGGFLCGIGSAEVRGRVLMFLVLIAPFLLLRTRKIGALCALAASLFVFVDLTLASVNRYHHPFLDAPQCYQTYEPAIGAAQEQVLGGRVLVSAHPLDNALPSAIGMLYPAAVANAGMAPLSPAQAKWWARLKVPRTEADEPIDIESDAPAPEAMTNGMIDFMSVRAILSAPDGALYSEEWADQAPQFHELKVEGAARLVANDNALPRAYFVSEWRKADTVDTVLDLLSDPAFPRKHACVILAQGKGVESLAALLPEGPQPNTPPTTETTPNCRIESPSPESIIIHTTAQTPGVTILTDTFAPGWHAKMDGIEWPILQTNAIFRGLATPPGDHTFTLEYRPQAFQAGRFISAASLLALSLAALITLARGNALL